MRTGPCTAALMAALVAVPAAARAQATLPPAGTGSVGVTFQTIDNTGHRATDGAYVDNGRSRSAALFLDVEYGITRWWAVSAGVPLVFARYTDDDPPPPQLGEFQPVDQCRCWHAGWQDFGFATHLNLIDSFDHVTAVTTSLEVGIPSHAYTYRGEAVLGRRLHEARLVINASHRLDALSRRVTIGARYGYALVERVLDVPNNRSNLTVNVSVRAAPAVTVRGFASWQWTHGGLRAGSAPASDFPIPGDFTTSELKAEHDRMLRDNRTHVGGGVSYRLPRGNLFGTFTYFASGTDTHAGYAITGGVVVPFRLKN